MKTALFALALLSGCVHAEFSLPESSNKTEAESRGTPTGPRVVMIRTTADDGRPAYTPLACYDATRRTTYAGAPCAELIPKGAELRCTNGGSVLVTERKWAPCAGGGDPWPAFSTGSAIASCEVAVYSPGTPPEVVVVPKVAPRVSREEAAAITDRIRQLHPEATEPLQLAQAVSVDLDADGAKERLIAASILPVFSGIVMSNATSPNDFVILHTDPALEWRLRGVMDIDSDGTAELWFSATGETHREEIVERVAGVRAMPLGSLQCP